MAAASKQYRPSQFPRRVTDNKLNHRVRRVGCRVRIDYMPVSEHVTTVRYAEAPVQAS
jgi:hypothetical protein